MRSEAILAMIEQALDRRARESAEAVQATAQTQSIRSNCHSRIANLKEEISAIEAEELKLRNEADRIGKQKAQVNAEFSRIQSLLANQWHLKMNASIAIDREKNILRTTCSPVINQFLDTINIEINRLRKLEPASEVGFGKKNLLADNPKTPRLFYSQQPAIDGRLCALYAARERVEQLKLRDCTEEELRSEFENIWANLPAIDGLGLVKI